MPNQNIKILFFGTCEFAVPILQKLIDEKYKISAVVTPPDKPAGRKQIFTPPPVKTFALKHGIQIFQPDKLQISNFPSCAEASAGRQFLISNLDLIITASYGKIIPKEILDLPKYGAINVHPSLLPKYRGPSPIQYAILNGDKETGVTIMLMDEKMDHGHILAQEKIKIMGEDMDPRLQTYMEMGAIHPFESEIYKPRFPELHDTLSRLGADSLIKTIPKWISGEIKPIPQNDAQATYTKIIKKEDGKIDWTKSANDIERKIRAFTPLPGCWTLLPDGMRVKIIDAVELPSECIDDIKTRQDLVSKGVGQIIRLTNKKLAIKCGADFLEIKKLQIEGKKVMTNEEFLNGYKIIGQVLGLE
ncbi:MAG: methionyl-tRNA formyltransferase [bacterium]